MAKQAKQTKQTAAKQTAQDITNANPNQLGAVVSEKPKTKRIRLGISTEQFLELCDGAETLREIQSRALNQLGKALTEQQINSRRAQIASIFKENGYSSPFPRLKGQGAPRIDVAGLAARFGVKKVTQETNGEQS